MGGMVTDAEQRQHLAAVAADLTQSGAPATIYRRTGGPRTGYVECGPCIVKAYGVFLGNATRDYVTYGKVLPETNLQPDDALWILDGPYTGSYAVRAMMPKAFYGATAYLQATLEKISEIRTGDLSVP